MRFIRFKQLFCMSILLILLVAFIGCSSEETAEISDELEEVADVDAGEVEDTPDTAPSAPSDLWAPPADCPHLVVENLPAEDEVPYPHYPGSHAFGIGWSGETPKSTDIFLLATDPPEDVYNFYQEQMDGWHSEKVDHASYDYILWQGDADQLSETYAHNLPSILIRTPHDYEAEWLVGSQTAFTVVYFED